MFRGMPVKWGIRCGVIRHIHWHNGIAGALVTFAISGITTWVPLDQLKPHTNGGKVSCQPFPTPTRSG